MASNTAMNFTLSPTLLAKLSGSNNGVYVYAFAFNGGGALIGSTTLVSGGAVQPASSFSLQLTNGSTTVVGGNVVIVTQQVGPGGTSTLPSSVHVIGDVLDTVKATAGNYRYDTIEVTLLGSGSDVANLTNIVQFGAPIELSVSYSAASGLPTDTRGYAVSGQTFVNDLKALSPPDTQNYPFTSPGNSPLNEQRETLALANNVAPNPLNVPGDWNSYVNGFQAVASNVRLASYFNGVGSDAPASLSYFEVKYDSGAGVYWLVPVSLAGISTTNYTLRIPALQTAPSQINALTQNIYTQAGTLDVYTAMNGTLVKSYDTFTPNNAYGDLAKHFVAGFDAGFWGGSANSLNPLVTAKVDLNKTWNWGADYAYEAINAAPGSNSYGYTNTIGTGAGTVGDPSRKMFYDPFAAQFFQKSNSYGYSYSDLISNGGGVNPGISVYDPGTRTNVTSIGVTLFDLGETPTGYRPPTHNYVAPTGSTYSAAATSSTDQFLFDFSLAGKYAPVDGTPIAFRFYAPGQSQAGADGFVTLNLPSHYAEIYSLANSGGQWTLTANANSGALGFFIINGIPVTSDASTAWYQIVLGTGSSAKTYNIYAKATTNSIDSIIMDGGADAQLIPGQASQAKFSFAPAGTITFDPAVFASASPQPRPMALPAPLLGDVDGGIFQALGSPHDVEQGQLAFSSQSVGGESNEIVGGNIAKIDFASIDNPSWIFAPLATEAQIDGAWITDLLAQFGNGVYSALMQQYKPDDLDLDTPVEASTRPLNFTVQLDTLTLTAASGGDALALVQGASSTEGNWIELTATKSTLPNGSLIAYATDSAGNLIARDGETVTTVFDDAVLGRLGAVSSDGGTPFFQGSQSVYLSVGLELHFAVVTANGVIDTHPKVTVTGENGLLAVEVGDQAGAIGLAAHVDNNLSASASLAGSQRMTDDGWIYLKTGTTASVDLAWSGAYVNSLYFVRLDVDPGDASQWQVGGVAYGNTAAFRSAVQDNWEFVSKQGNSTGTATVTWTVQGESGFYAPVLVSPDGMWTIDNSPTNTANADGLQHVRIFGENIFGFEDMSLGKGADFDYNDMVMRLTIF